MLREFRRIPVNRRGGGVHDALHTGVLCRIEDVQRPVHVDGVGRNGITHGPRHGRQRGLVEHDIDPFDRLAHRVITSDVAFDDLDLPPEAAEVVPLPRGEIVEHPHTMRAFDERFDKIGSDEPGTSRNQCVHVISLHS